MTGQRTGLIHNRSFTVFWLGQALSVLGGSVSLLALPLLVLEVTGSLVELGLITALSGVFALATGTFAGHVVDRVDRRRLMIGCDLARAVLLGSVPLVWSFGGPRIWWLYVLTALVTVLKTLFDVAYVSAVPSLVEPADLAAANGRLMGTFALGTLGRHGDVGEGHPLAQFGDPYVDQYVGADHRPLEAGGLLDGGHRTVGPARGGDRDDGGGVRGGHQGLAAEAPAVRGEGIGPGQPQYGVPVAGLLDGESEGEHPGGEVVVEDLVRVCRCQRRHRVIVAARPLPPQLPLREALLRG